MSSKRILVVDNEPSIQEVAQICLETVAGWQTILASSGLEGLAVAERELPDAILLDVMMPDMDGIATFQALQTYPETEQIPVIFLTAKAQTVEKCQLNDLGVSGVITKPFNSLDLPSQISKILHWEFRS